MSQRARALRRNATDAERKLWQHLRARQLQGARFRRQVPVGRYVVDFLCERAGVVVEIDGGQHAEQAEYDAARSAELETHGRIVLRFWNNEVLGNLEGVLDRIGREIAAAPSPQPSPTRGEGDDAVTSADAAHKPETPR